MYFLYDITASGQLTSIKDPSLCFCFVVPTSLGWAFVDNTLTTFLFIQAVATKLSFWRTMLSPLCMCMFEKQMNQVCMIVFVLLCLFLIKGLVCFSNFLLFCRDLQIIRKSFATCANGPTRMTLSSNFVKMVVELKKLLQ